METARVYQLLRAIWVIFIMIASILLLYWIFPLIYPFLIAWVIAYMLNPMVGLFVRKLRFPRWLAVTAALLIFIGVVSALITLLISQLITQIEKISELVSNNLDSWINSLTSFIRSDVWQDMLDKINQFYINNIQHNQTFDSNIQSVGTKIAETVSSLLSGLVTLLINLIASLPNLAAVFIVVLLASFFISKDWYKIKRWLLGVTPKKLLSSVTSIWQGLQKALFGYVRAQFIMISITAVFIIIGLLVLRVNYAYTIGILIGIVDLLPYLGTGAVMIPWAIYLFINGNLTLGIGISILYGIVLVTRQLIEPKVLAASIGLNSLAALIAMFVGLSMFGVLGLIVGPVTLVILLAIHRAHIFHDIYNYIMKGAKKG